MTDHRALVLALVVDREHGRVSRDMGRDRERLVEGDVALAIDHHHAIEVHLARPGAPGRDGGKGRHNFQRPRRGAGFVDEGQFFFVHGIGADADAIGVEHHLAIAVGIFLAEVFQRHQLFVFDRHLFVLSRIIYARHPRESGGPVNAGGYWIPAFAGMTICCLTCVSRISLSELRRVGKAKRAHHLLRCSAAVGTALLRLCPPYAIGQAGVKNGSGAPSVGLNTSFTFWPIFKVSMSQSTMLVCIEGPSFRVT